VTRYVLGFAFDSAGENVVLIRKTKPAWQAGKYNGVGGKVEAKELGIDAMIREFYEEAGVMTLPENWTRFSFLKGPGWTCECFYLFNNHIARIVSTQTDEEIHTFPVFIATSEIPTISNLPWLIPAALNHKENNEEFHLTAEYAR
jgi:8-oxo-dGTP diphosphatase